MAKRTRQIIKIDEELCNGCGLCVPSCAEGALQVIDGKARLVSERYCDGLGACLGECPQGAISIEEREADEFDEAAAIEHVKSTQGEEAAARMQANAHAHSHSSPAHAQHHSHAAHGKHSGFVCPSARIIDRTSEDRQPRPSAATEDVPSELRQWPVKLYLVNPTAPYFENADLLIAADCVPFAYGGFHPDFLQGKTLVTGCPKFDDVEVYADKLTQIMQRNDIKSVTVLQMEVPCCSGMLHLARQAIMMSGKDIPLEVVTISLDGRIKSTAPVMA